MSRACGARKGVRPAGLAPGLSSRLAAEVSRALLASPFAHPRSWPSAVVVLSSDGAPRVTSRGDHAHFLLANDLAGLARECLRRLVPPGQILVRLDVDLPDVAAGFFVFPLARVLAGVP